MSNLFSTQYTHCIEQKMLEWPGIKKMESLGTPIKGDDRMNLRTNDNEFSLIVELAGVTMVME